MATFLESFATEEKPTIRGTVISHVDPDKVPELERATVDAFCAVASNANALAFKQSMHQLNTRAPSVRSGCIPQRSINTAIMDGALDSATPQAYQVHEISSHGAAPKHFPRQRLHVLNVAVLSSSSGTLSLLQVLSSLEHRYAKVVPRKVAVGIRRPCDGFITDLDLQL